MADFANAIVNVYVPSKNEGELVLFATERPHTIFFVSGPVGGSLLDLQEEPLVKYTFEKGKSIHGHREIGTGADEASIVMITMPIISDHRTIAVVTIETTEETINSEGYGHIIKAATNLIEDTSRDYTEDIYRPIGETDGVLIADRHDRIVFANLAAQRIYRVLGVSNPVGMLRRDRMLTRHVTSETVKPGQPNEKEITAGGLVLVMREIPVEASGNPKGCIVVVEDVTALREKEKEIRIQKAFASMMEGRTSFIVAHRLSTIQNADIILVMKDGHIIEQGNHQELLEKNGFYAQLYNSQFAIA